MDAFQRNCSREVLLISIAICERSEWVGWKGSVECGDIGVGEGGGGGEWT